MRKGLFTTNDQPPAAPVEPKPLNHITTAIIPGAKPAPEPKPLDLSKIITTHDPDTASDIIIDEIRRREEQGDDKVAVKLGEPINMGADAVPDHEPGTPGDENAAAPSHKKPGRKKKA